MRLIFACTLLAALLLTGCGGAPLKDPTPGWPTDLVRTEHVAEPAQVNTLCGGIYDGCAWINLCEHTCDKYYSDAEPSDAKRAHEEGHCQGRDHWFSTVLADLLKAFQSGGLCTGAVKKADEDAADASFAVLMMILI